MLLKEYAVISLLGFILGLMFLGKRQTTSFPNIFFKIFILLNLPFLLMLTEKYLQDGVFEVTYFEGLGIRLKLYLDLAGLSFLWLNYLLFAFLVIFINKINQSSLMNTLLLMLFSVNNLFFIAGDSLTFLIFWEAMLIPATLLLWYFSAGDRMRNALEFIIYNFGFSIFLILGVLLIFKFKGAFEYNFSGISHDYIIALLLFIGIMVKTPVFPLHGWLINTYYNLPSPITAIFSGILSKYAIYAFYRLFADVSMIYGFLLLVVILSSIISSFLAWSQRDLKKIFTYMSMSHLNIMLAGGLALAPYGGITILVPFSLFHGLLAFILFLYCYHLELYGKSLIINDYGALTLTHPFFTFFFTSYLLILAGFPLFGYFYLEFIVVSSVFKYSLLFGFLLIIAMSINLIYKSVVFYKLVFSKQSGSGSKTLIDLSFSQILLSFIILLIVLILTFYLYEFLKLFTSGGV